MIYTFRKWNNIGELCEKIAENSILENFGKELKRVCYAPHIGYRAWIFKYKGTLVSLWDMGNGHYGFYSAADWRDVFTGWFTEKIGGFKYGKF